MLNSLPVLSGLRVWHRYATSRRQAARRPFAEQNRAHDALAASLPASWDERGYLSDHPDVAQEVLAGHLASGYAHWLQCGYAERRALPSRALQAERARLPRATLMPYWDEGAYLARHPHVATLIALGLYDDGLVHCWALRQAQRPVPTPNARWDEDAYLWMYPDVAEALRTSAFASGFAHWLACGLEEGRPAPETNASPPAAVRGDPAPSTPPNAVATVRGQRGGPDQTSSPGDAPTPVGPSDAARAFAALAQQMRKMARDGTEDGGGDHVRLPRRPSAG